MGDNIFSHLKLNLPKSLGFLTLLAEPPLPLGREIVFAQPLCYFDPILEHSAFLRKDLLQKYCLY